jgi:hypothetical protein
MQVVVAFIWALDVGTSGLYRTMLAINAGQSLYPIF